MQQPTSLRRERRGEEGKEGEEGRPTAEAAIISCACRSRKHLRKCRRSFLREKTLRCRLSPFNRKEKSAAPAATPAAALQFAMNVEWGMSMKELRLSERRNAWSTLGSTCPRTLQNYFGGITTCAKNEWLHAAFLRSRSVGRRSLTRSRSRTTYSYTMACCSREAGLLHPLARSVSRSFEDE